MIKDNSTEETQNPGNTEIVAEIPVTDEESQVPESGDFMSMLTEAINSGMLFRDFKVKLAMSGFMRDSDDLSIGKINRIGQLHCAILNVRESSSSVKLLIGGKLTPMKKEDFDHIYNEGVFAGSDMVLYMDDDDMIMLKGLYIIQTDGSLKIF